MDQKIQFNSWEISDTDMFPINYTLAFRGTTPYVSCPNRKKKSHF